MVLNPNTVRSLIVIMKFVVILVAVALVYTSHANPIGKDIEDIIPKDNSHYVEGESRYIWMPDDQGNLTLVDLYEEPDMELLQERNGANNQYWLFTRRNQNNAQVLVQGNVNSVRNSNYNAGWPIVVIVHGWNSNGNSAINPTVRNAFLAIRDCNVIVVDWNRLANSAYTIAVNGVPSVGTFLGNFLIWLINSSGGNWNNVHLVGFSLGAHVVGNAGRTAGRRPGRITGLDPAGPQWGGNRNALNANDGQYVEVIHTNGGALGINDPIGRTNFYPNGGRNQAGCGININCSHSRAYQLFAATVQRNHLFGRQCGNLSQANNNACTGGSLSMGNGNLSKSGNGLFALSTGSNFPF